MVLAAGVQVARVRKCLRERIIEFRAWNKDRVYVACGDQNFSVCQQRCGVALPREVQRSNVCERLSRWIVDLRVHNGTIGTCSAGDQNGSVGEKRRGVIDAGIIRIVTRTGKCTVECIEDLGSGYKTRGAALASDDQHRSIVQQGSSVQEPRTVHTRRSGAERGGCRVIKFCGICRGRALVYLASGNENRTVIQQCRRWVGPCRVQVARAAETVDSERTRNGRHAANRRPQRVADLAAIYVQVKEENISCRTGRLRQGAAQDRRRTRW